MRKNEIDAWLAELTRALGPARPPVPKAEFLRLNAKKDLVGMFRLVRKHMRLGIRLRLLFRERVRNDAAMEVYVPRPMPLYGTAEYRHLCIVVAVSETYLRDAPAEMLVVGIAHELSHVLLAALGNPLWQVEPAVDLAAMVLGFRDFFLLHSECGVKRERIPPSLWDRVKRILTGYEAVQEKVLTHRIGYLTAEELGYAHACLQTGMIRR